MSLINKMEISTTARLAVAMVWAYAATVDTLSRPIDRRLAQAKLHGMTVAANALGYGHTDFAVTLAVSEVMRDRPQPEWQATGVGHARDQWELEATEALTAALERIL